MPFESKEWGWTLSQSTSLQRWELIIITFSAAYTPPAPVFYDLFLFLGVVSIVTTRRPRMPAAGPLPPWVPLTHHWLALQPFICAHALIRGACVFLLFFLPLTFGNEVCVPLPAVRPAWGAGRPPHSANTLSQNWQQCNGDITRAHTHRACVKMSSTCSTCLYSSFILLFL